MVDVADCEKEVNDNHSVYFVHWISILYDWFCVVMALQVLFYWHLQTGITDWTGETELWLKSFVNFAFNKKPPRWELHSSSSSTPASPSRWTRDWRCWKGWGSPLSRSTASSLRMWSSSDWTRVSTCRRFKREIFGLKVQASPFWSSLWAMTMMPWTNLTDWFCFFQHHCSPLLLLILLITSDFLKGVSLSKKEPAHFVSVFNKQQKEAKMLSRFKTSHHIKELDGGFPSCQWDDKAKPRYAYATLQASSLLSKQFQLTRQQVLPSVPVDQKGPCCLSFRNVFRRTEGFPTYLQLCFQQFWIIIDPIVRSGFGSSRDPDITLLGTVLIQATDLAKKVPFLINCKMEFGLSHTLQIPTYSCGKSEHAFKLHEYHQMLILSCLTQFCLSCPSWAQHQLGCHLKDWPALDRVPIWPASGLGSQTIQRQLRCSVTGATLGSK